MNLHEQKLIVETLVASPEVFARCVGIIRPEFFDLEYQRPIAYLLDYYSQYSSIPSLKSVQAKFNTHKFEERGFVTTTDEESTCDEVELFCRQRALYEAIKKSTALIAESDHKSFEKVEVLVQDALSVSLTKDLGIDMYDDPYNKLMSMRDTQKYEPTHIKELDAALGGGLARKQTTLFSANSGGGKSIMMANIGANYARESGMHVVLISLELSQEMIFIRNSAIMTGYKAATWQDNIDEIAESLEQQKDAGGGSFIIKRMPNGSSANDIRSYLKQYETVYKRKPDVLIVDYLDLMSPNGGIKNMNISEQDKFKSEQLAELGHTYNCVVVSASQQNRDAIKSNAPDQSVIAGGLTKVNTVDNYISILMTPEMRLQGIMQIHFLKTRSSSAVGSMRELAYNPDTLQVADDPSGFHRNNIMQITSKRKSPTLNAVATEGVQIPNATEMPDANHDNGVVGDLLEYGDPKEEKKPRESTKTSPKNSVRKPLALDDDDDSPPWDSFANVSTDEPEKKEEPVQKKDDKPKERKPPAEKKPPLQIVDDLSVIEEKPKVKESKLVLDGGRSVDTLVGLLTGINGDEYSGTY